MGHLPRHRLTVTIHPENTPEYEEVDDMAPDPCPELQALIDEICCAGVYDEMGELEVLIYCIFFEGGRPGVIIRMRNHRPIDRRAPRGGPATRGGPDATESCDCLHVQAATRGGALREGVGWQ